MRFIGEIGNLKPLLDENGLPKYKEQLWYRIPLFSYHSVHPYLTFEDDNGVQYQMDANFITDGGSIPPFLVITPFIHLDRFNFPRTYFYHDQAFQYGGYYVKYPNETIFRFRLYTRVEVNKILKSMLVLDGATSADKFFISNAVNIGSNFVWDDVKKPLKQREARRLSKINVYDKNGNLIEDNGGL